MLRFEVISSSQLDYLLDNPCVQIIDVREKCLFDKVHIRNAINIPYEELSKKHVVLPQNKILIFYCAHGGTGLLAAKEYFDRGYTVKALIGGIEDYSGKNKVFDTCS